MVLLKQYETLQNKPLQGAGGVEDKYLPFGLEKIMNISMLLITAIKLSKKSFFNQMKWCPIRYRQDQDTLSRGKMITGP